MANFLFQPDPIDYVQFKPIKIDIHQGVIKIVDEELHYDFEINNTESVIVRQIEKRFSKEFKLHLTVNTKDMVN